MGVDRDELAFEIAAFRYRLIAEAAELSEEDDGVSAAITEAASKTYVDPSGIDVSFVARTLWRYLAKYREGRISALIPKIRKDGGTLRRISPATLEKAIALRSGRNAGRATKTLIDILERDGAVAKNQLKRSTLDRHLDRLGKSRKQQRKLGVKVFGKIKTEAAFELVIADFHHGPYVRVGTEVKRALLLAFIDHYTRQIVESRYYIHENFVALRCGFRRLILAHGLFAKLYIDNGPSFHTARFLAACAHNEIDISVVHSKAYVSEGRGLVERLNRTYKEQFENEVRAREELLTLDELNVYHEAWREERYHNDTHSELGESPRARFSAAPMTLLRKAPDLSVIDELLRLRARRNVHKKWSTVEVLSNRYLVDSALRGRKVHVLYDPSDPAYVLIENERKIVQRAYPQKAGESPPDPPESIASPGSSPDYLELLRRDHEARRKAELSALRLQPQPALAELALVDLVALIESCRARQLSDVERSEVSAFFRKMRPMNPELVREAIESSCRSLGTALHVSVYLEALQTQLVRQRAKKGDTRK